MVALLAFIGRKALGELAKEPYLWLFLIWILIVYASALTAASEFPQWSDEIYNESRKYLRLFACLLIGWWLGGSVRSAFNILWLAFFGFLVALVLQSDLSTWVHWLSSQRFDLEDHNAQHVGLFFALSLVGFLAFRSRLIGARNNWQTYVRVFAWLLIVAFLLAGLIGTKGRASWVGFVGAFIVIAALQGYAWWRKCSTAKVYGFSWGRRGIALTIALTIASVAIIGTAYPSLEERLLRERDVESVSLALQEGVEEVDPSGSMGIRVHQWHIGLHYIAERPWFGWGPAIRWEVYESDPLGLVPDDLRLQGGFHNSYIKVAFTFGIIGLALWGVVVLGLLWRAWVGWREGKVPFDMAVFVTAATTVLVSAHAFNSFAQNRTGMQVGALIGGIVLAQVMARPPKHELDADYNESREK
nr:O-antigen ligase family protein [Halorhodospira halochloris]